MDADPRDALIQQLQGEITALRAEAQSLRDTVKQLIERVEQLQREALRQAAPFRRKGQRQKAT